MRFNPKARLDRSQVSNRGGGRGGGGLPGLPGSGGKQLGGGVVGIVVLLLVVFLNGGLDGLTGVGGPSAGSSGAGQGQQLDQCQTGADATDDEDCARLAVVNSMQGYWTDALPDQSGTAYREAVTNTFSGQVATGCGSASSAVGPFYCPADEGVYLDATFFDDMLEGRLGGRGGDFAEAYVIAHEYGHHVQNILGTMGSVGRGQGEESDAVRLELQADCYAGMWAGSATRVLDENGEVLISDLDRQDIAEALDAAQAVGDDRIQQRSGGRVDEDLFTHGTSEQRMRWFTTGLEQGSLAACDTFRAARL